MVRACCKSAPSSAPVPFEYLFLLVDEEVEGLVELVVDVLRLHLLRDEIEHDVVDAEVQLLHRLLAVLGPRLGALQPVGQRPEWLFSSVVRFHCRNVVKYHVNSTEFHDNTASVPDLFLVLLLPLLRLLLGHFQGLQVFANHAKLFLQINDLQGFNSDFI